MPRSYGTTRAAPWTAAPSTPAVGDTYFNTTDKSQYVYDGTVWIKVGPGAGGPPTGTAGGSLTDTYPNPGIAASAVRGTPASGGTAREIQKASIWGGDDLIDLSVPDAKISALAYTKVSGSPLTVQARIQRTTTQSITTGTWTAVVVDTVQTNVGGVWAVGAPDHFTIATAGFYLVGGTVQFMDGAGAGTARQLAVTGPGVTPTYGLEAVKNVGNAGLSVSTGVFFSAGATVYLMVNQDSGAAVTIGGYSPSIFWIARVA